MGVDTTRGEPIDQYRDGYITLLDGTWLSRGGTLNCVWAVTRLPDAVRTLVDAAYERGKAEGLAEATATTTSYVEFLTGTASLAADERDAARADVERLAALLAQAEQHARDLQDDGVTMPDREDAKALVHPALHDLDVRITDLRGDCHCNLVAEVVLDALYGLGPKVVIDASAEPTGGSDA
jgi:hypothetical protein